MRGRKLGVGERKDEHIKLRIKIAQRLSEDSISFDQAENLLVRAYRFAMAESDETLDEVGRAIDEQS